MPGRCGCCLPHTAPPPRLWELPPESNNPSQLYASWTRTQPDIYMEYLSSLFVLTKIQGRAYSIYTCSICIRTWASLNRQSLQSESLPVQPHFPWRLGWCLLWTLWSAGSWLDQLTRNHPPGTQHQQAWLYDILKEQEQEVDFWQIFLFYYGWDCFYKQFFLKDGY